MPSEQDSNTLFGNRVSNLLGAAVPPSSLESSSSSWQPPPCEQLQSFLSGYEVHQFVARGGMGAVYRGVQLSLGRQVAIKILPPELVETDPHYAERFKQEARAMGQLNHPGIVAVYDFGEMQDGTLYFIMEFIEGTDVAQMVAAQGRLPSAHAMAIAAHVCDALQYAHQRGVVHRDIKPANIMVGYDGRVKVADFGLAKQLRHTDASLTQSGYVMGTPHFVAPEALTLGVAVDHRADIYAVGVMLYQMLTGKVPQGVFEMPSLQVSGLDPRYDQIVAGAMREDRDRRYQHISEMRRALDAIMTQPVMKTEAAPKAVPGSVIKKIRLPAQGAKSSNKPTSPPHPPRRTASPPPKSLSRPWMAWIVGLCVIGTCVGAWIIWPGGKPVVSSEPVSNTASLTVHGEDKQTVVPAPAAAAVSAPTPSASPVPAQGTQIPAGALRTSAMVLTPLVTWSNGERASVTFYNQLDREVELFHLPRDGGMLSYRVVKPGGVSTQDSYLGHVWMVATRQPEPLAVLSAGPSTRYVIVDGPSKGASRYQINTAARTMRQTTAPKGRAEVLAETLPEVLSAVFDSIENDLPFSVEELLRMRDGLVLEGKSKPAGSLDAYRAGYALCLAVIAAAEERKQARDMKAWAARSAALKPHLEELQSKFLAEMKKLPAPVPVPVAPLVERQAFPAAQIESRAPYWRLRCSAKDRLSAISGWGGPPEAETAAERAILFLKTKQHPDGSWGERNKSGTTALALLAFLGRCETAESRELGDVVIRAAMSLVELCSRRSDGILAPDPAQEGAAMEHGLALAALAEFYTSGRLAGKSIPGLREACEKALAATLTHQLPSGAWSSGATGTAFGKADASGAARELTSLCQIQGLHFARQSGLNLEPIQEAMKRARTFCEKDAATLPVSRYATTGLLGLATPAVLEQQHSAAVREWSRKALNVETASLLEWWAYTLASARGPAKISRQWNAAMIPALIARQNPDGSWRTRAGAFGDDVVTPTALAALLLEASYQDALVAADRQP